MGFVMTFHTLVQCILIILLLLQSSSQSPFYFQIFSVCSGGGMSFCFFNPINVIRVVHVNVGEGVSQECQQPTSPENLPPSPPLLTATASQRAEPCEFLRIHGRTLVSPMDFR